MRFTLLKDGFRGSFFKKKPKELMSMRQIGRIRTFPRNAGNGWESSVSVLRFALPFLIGCPRRFAYLPAPLNLTF